MRKLIGTVVIGVVGLAVLGYFGGTEWITTRGGVVADSVKDTLDSAIGKMKIAEKEIELGLEKFDEFQAKLTRSVAEHKAKVAQIDRQIERQQSSIDKDEPVLVKLRDKLQNESTISITVSGKEYARPKVQQAAEKLITRRKTAESCIATLRATKEQMLATIERLSTKLAASQSQEASLRGRLAQIKAKKAQAIAYRADQGEDEDDSMADTLAKLIENVDALEVSVETDVALEEQKWLAQTATGLGEVDVLLQEIKDPSETVADIDAILGITDVDDQ